VEGLANTTMDGSVKGGESFDHRATTRLASQKRLCGMELVGFFRSECRFHILNVGFGTADTLMTNV
jgi:hypothetical protein